MVLAQPWLLECAESQMPPTLSWLSDSEMAILRSYQRPKRRRDWLLGRWTAKQLVARHFAPGDMHLLSGFSILPDQAGIPVVFKGTRRVDLSLSLSHRDGRALSVIASDHIQIGCDLEKNESRSRAFVETFFTDSEIAQIDHFEKNRWPAAATLIWSAKESVLKLLGVGLRVDTRCVSVSIDQAGATTLDWHPFSASLVDGTSFTGWWKVDPFLIRTVAVNVVSSPPRIQPDFPEALHEMEMGGHEDRPLSSMCSARN